MVPFKQLPPLVSLSSIHLLLVLPLILVVVVVVVDGPCRGIPRKRIAPPGGARTAPTQSRGGTTEVPEDAVQDCRALLWDLPLAIIFFTIIVVIVVTIGKGGHSLGTMECAPSFWLPWMALAEMGKVWDDGCGLWFMMHSPATHMRAGMMHSKQCVPITNKFS